MNYIYEASKAFTSDFCKEIIAKRKEMTIDPYDDVKYNDSDHPNEPFKGLYDELNKTIHSHIDTYFKSFEDLMDLSDIYLNNYNVVRQALNHHDSLHYDTQFFKHKNETLQRPFVCLVYLNDSFYGGQCIFPVQKTVIAPEEGKLVIFPASYLFPHFVASISEEERYSIRVTYAYKMPIFNMDLDKWDAIHDTNR